MANHPLPPLTSDVRAGARQCRSPTQDPAHSTGRAPHWDKLSTGHSQYRTAARLQGLAPPTSPYCAPPFPANTQPILPWALLPSKIPPDPIRAGPKPETHAQTPKCSTCSHCIPPFVLNNRVSGSRASESLFGVPVVPRPPRRAVDRPSWGF